MGFNLVIDYLISTIGPQGATYVKTSFIFLAGASTGLVLGIFLLVNTFKYARRDKKLDPLITLVQLPHPKTPFVCNPNKAKDYLEVFVFVLIWRICGMKNQEQRIAFKNKFRQDLLMWAFCTSIIFFTVVGCLFAVTFIPNLD